MKRLILSASFILLGIAAVAPAALAMQASTTAELSEGSTFHELIRHNRDQRRKN